MENRKEKQNKFRNIKRIGNVLWVIGTCIIFVVLIIAVIMFANRSYKNNLRENVIDNLVRYNASHFNYNPSYQESNETVLNVSVDYSDEFLDYVDTIIADDVVLNRVYNQSFVKIVNPENLDFIENFIGNVDCYSFYYQGLWYYGNNDGYISELEIPVINSDAVTVDDFINDLENALITDFEDSIVLFNNVSFGQIFITSELRNNLAEVLLEQDYVTRLKIELQILTTAGHYTSSLKSLIDAYEKS